MENNPALTLNFKTLSQKIGCPEEDLQKIFAAIPLGDSEDLTYLDAAGRWVLEVSALVDNYCPQLPSKEKIAQKLYLMGKLLEFKAYELCHPFA